MFSILTKVGMPGLIILLTLLIYFLVTFLRSHGPGYGVLFLIIGKLFQQLINGFTFSHNLGSIFGQADTVLSYLFIGIAVFETIFFASKLNWNAYDVLVLIGLFGIGFSSLFWRLYYGENLGMSTFIFLLILAVFMVTKPDIQTLRFAPILSFLLLLINLLCAFFGYQNPYYPYFQLDYGIDGPYHNFVWDLFGFTERMRGPYATPNVFAYNVVFILVLSRSFKSKLYPLSLLMSVLLVLLSGSRISLFALVSFVLLDIFQRKGVSISGVLKNAQSQKNSRSLRRWLILTLLTSAILFVTKNPTGNGRTNSYAEVFSAVKGHYLFGTGTAGAENTVITIFGSYGLLGVFFVLLIVIGLKGAYSALDSEMRGKSLPLLATFFVASTGESLLNGGTYDIGLLYIMLFLTFRTKSIK